MFTKSEIKYLQKSIRDSKYLKKFCSLSFIIIQKYIHKFNTHVEMNSPVEDDKPLLYKKLLDNEFESFHNIFKYWNLKGNDKFIFDNPTFKKIHNKFNQYIGEINLKKIKNGKEQDLNYFQHTFETTYVFAASVIIHNLKNISFENTPINVNLPHHLNFLYFVIDNLLKKLNENADKKQVKKITVNYEIYETLLTNCLISYISSKVKLYHLENKDNDVCHSKQNNIMLKNTLNHNNKKLSENHTFKQNILFEQNEMNNFSFKDSLLKNEKNTKNYFKTNLSSNNNNSSSKNNDSLKIDEDIFHPRKRLKNIIEEKSNSKDNNSIKNSSTNKDQFIDDELDALIINATKECEEKKKKEFKPKNFIHLDFNQIMSVSQK